MCFSTRGVVAFHLHGHVAGLDDTTTDICDLQVRHRPSQSLSLILQDLILVPSFGMARDLTKVPRYERRHLNRIEKVEYARHSNVSVEKAFLHHR